MPTTLLRPFLLQSDLPGLPLRHRGKVRDVFDLPAERLPAGMASGTGSKSEYLLMVATDRLSAFDVVLPDPIPGKGEMLCQISNFWFGKTQHIIPNHLTGIDVAAVLPPGVDAGLYEKRAVVTKRLKPVPVECIARGYIIGSGWKDYQRTGRISGIALPDGLRQAEQLAEPIFTPSTKAAVGDHDEKSTSTPRCARSAPTWPNRCAMRPCACMPSRAITRRSAAFCWPTPSSNSAPTPTAVCT